MLRIKSVVGFLALVLVASLIAHADEPTTKPSRAGRLVKPWGDLTSLTAEQKAKIIDIHQQANAQRKAIDAQEEADIMALLTDEQKAELKTLAAEKRAQAKERQAERKKAAAEAKQEK